MRGKIRYQIYRSEIEADEGSGAMAKTKSTWRPRQKRGRPRKYRPPMCQVAYDILAQGEPLVAVAADIGVIPETISEWQKDFVDFSVAVKLGKAEGERVFVRELREAARIGTNVGGYALYGRNVYS